MATGDPAPDDPPDQDIAALYAGPLGEFVAGRDARARALRAAGRRDEAAAVKALRKPSVVAWSLDAARRADPGAVDALVAAVADLGAAQEGGGDLRAALAGLREAQVAVVDAAVAATAGHGQPVARDQVAPALLAVVSEPAALAELAAGRLAAVPPAGGMGVAVPPRAADRAAASARPAPPRARRPPPARTGISRRRAAPGPGGTAGSEPGAGPRERLPPRRKGAADRVLARAEAAAAAAAEAEAAATAQAEAAEAAARAADRAVDAARRQAATARRAADLARQKATAAAARRAQADERVAAARAALP